MLGKIKKIVKSNDYIANIVRYLIVPVTVIKRLCFNIGAFFRENNIPIGKSYDLLKRFKGIYPNKRCFVVATGPSLAIKDLEKLKKEITFSMNSIYLSYSSTSWRPTYYGIQDPLVYEKIQHEIHDEDFKACFIGSNVAKSFNLKPQNNRYIFPLDLLNHQMPKSKINTKFSDNICTRIYSGYNIAYTMIQIAIYMGFTEIYLLGADCDYLQTKKYFKEDKNRGEEKYFTKSFLAGNTDRFIAAYLVAKQYADQHNIKIYNATRGGKLEVFERVDFDSLFSNVKNLILEEIN